MLLYCVVTEILTHHSLWKETNECFSLEIASRHHCEETQDSGTYSVLPASCCRGQMRLSTAELYEASAQTDR